MRFARWVGAAAAALLAAGCAVHSNPGQPLQLRLDQAEVFGQDVGELRLPTGSTARLRQFQGRYSVKFTEFQRVVEIDKATNVRLVGAQQFGDRTLVVLEKAERNCAFKTHLLAIRGREVAAWDFGNCETAPRIDADESEAWFDVPHRRGTTRYIFRDGKLLYGELRGAPGLPLAPPAVKDAAAPAAGSRLAFPLPPPAAPEPAPAAAPPAARRPAALSSPAPGPAVLPTRPQDLPRMPTKQQEPRIIYLDR